MIPASGLPPPPPVRRTLTTPWAVALGAGVVAGALLADPVPGVVVVGLGVVAVLGRWPALLVVAGVLAGSWSGARAVAGMEPPPSGPAQGEVTLLTDPEARWDDVEAVGRWRGRHLLVVAGGAAGELLGARAAGERVVVEGRIEPLGAGEAWRRDRHVVARLVVRTARPGRAADPPWRAANRVRRAVADGADRLADDDRSLLLGLVFGDDRGQSAALVDDFRGAGLSHLLAVSGQNVAFVLTLAAPLARRVRPVPRALLLAGVLGLFALVTRIEPSVLRAVAMAGLATLAALRGRPTPGLHLLGLAVAGLVVADPFLARQLGFRLSVAATAGILVLAPRIGPWVPGPALLGPPVAVAASAQVATAPLLLAAGASLPVVSIPANLLAGPLAGALMVWGLPVGVLAGVLPPAWAAGLHAPSTVGLAGLRALAATAASLPLGTWGWPHLAALALAAALARAPGRARRVSAALVALAVAAPGWGLRHPPVELRPGPGLQVWRAGGATVVVAEPGAGERRVLEGLRAAGVARIELLVVPAGAGAEAIEAAARHRARVGEVWTDDRARRARAGDLQVEVEAGAVRVQPIGGGAAAGRVGGRGPPPPPRPRGRLHRPRRGRGGRRLGPDARRRGPHGPAPQRSAGRGGHRRHRGRG